MSRSRPHLAVANEDEPALKRLFAAALLRHPHKHAEAAKRVFPGAGNLARAMHAAQHWPTDPDVVALMDDLTDADGLPNLAHTAREIWALCMDPDVAAQQRIAGFKLYAETMGFKPATADTGDGGGLSELMSLISGDGRPKPATAG